MILLVLSAAALAQDPSLMPAAAPAAEALTIPSGLLGDMGYVLAILGGTSSFGFLSLKGMKAAAARIGESVEKFTAAATGLVQDIRTDMKDGEPMTIKHVHYHVIHVVEYQGQGDPPPKP